jgi:hypothetical protein
LILDVSDGSVVTPIRREHWSSNFSVVPGLQSFFDVRRGNSSGEPLSLGLSPVSFSPGTRV